MSRHRIRNTRQRDAETRDEEAPLKGAEKTARVDLGLSLLSVLCKPGEPLSQYDIAAWCGCTHSAIWQLEQKALKNLRRKLNRIKDTRLREAIDHYFGGQRMPRPRRLR